VRSPGKGRVVVYVEPNIWTESDSERVSGYGCG
jgi:hypothetical protein